MTALTTILALTHLALGLGSGVEAWSLMARSVIGGLMASTLLTLLVIPVIYTSLAPKKVTQLTQNDQASRSLSLSNPHLTLHAALSPLPGKKAEAYCPFALPGRCVIIYLKGLEHLEIVHFNSTEIGGLPW